MAVSLLFLIFSFIVSNILQTLPQVKELFKNMLVTVVVILVTTALGLTWWIYRGVIAPLDKLRMATQKIKSGDLDFSVASEGVSEIADLCQDFEEMRQRLKETAEEKVEFDKESKELISNISHDLKTPITAVKGYVEGIMDGVANTPEKMERYIKEFDKESKELISNISHDLKTPITAVKGYVEGIMDGVANTPEKMERYIKTIYNKANEMDRLINELTFYSKMDTNKIPYTFNKISVTEFFDDCAEDLQTERGLTDRSGSEKRRVLLFQLCGAGSDSHCRC